MDQYVLSQKSQDDINDVYDFGLNRFGESQSINYLIGLKSTFELLLKNPQIGKNRNEIKERLFSFAYDSHIIFFRVYNNHLRIVRILHGSRDLKKFME